MKRCLIIGARAVKKLPYLAGDYVIAADNGYQTALQHNRKPDLLVGDFDSWTGPLPTDIPTIKLSCYKDDTDTLIAIKEGIKRGYSYFVLTGVLGGRLDHTIASIQSLMYLKAHGCDGIIVDDDTIVRLLVNETAEVPKREGYYLSVFSFSDQCEGVTLKGVRYPLQDATLTKAFPLGVSNKIESDFATITVKKGTLLIIESKK